MRNKSGQNLTHSIVQELGMLIVGGGYPLDEKFPIEAELCGKYGASRSVLREAVKMLSAKGLVSSRPRFGTWVEPETNWNILDPDVLRWLLERKPDLELFEEFTEMRLAVEPLAASLAAERGSEGDLLLIRSSLERMQAAEKGYDDPLESDIAFHLAILTASRNRLFIQLHELVSTALHFSIRLTNRFKGVKIASVADHELVACAISRHRKRLQLRGRFLVAARRLALVMGQGRFATKPCPARRKTSRDAWRFEQELTLELQQP